VASRVIGVDACKGGWIGIVLEPGEMAPPPECARARRTTTRAYLDPTIAGLVELAERDGQLDVIAIDIPIGAADRTRRRADVLARELVGPHRAATVFITPVRLALQAGDHASAVQINRELAGEGVSVQAFGLRERILEVARWAASTSRRTVEVHPEVSFRLMAGTPLRCAKTTWSGMTLRRSLLARAGIVLADELGAAGRAGVDDVLDAAAAAWSAQRVAAGTNRWLPDPPERFSDGWPCAIYA
jgi:predicted RNase H-like nuclease